MMKKIVLGVCALGLAFSVTACSEASSDRTSGAGKKADEYADTTHVVVNRNADDIPNVAYFCAGAYGWASTLSGGSADAVKTPSLVRFPEYDSTCSSAPR